MKQKFRLFVQRHDNSAYTVTVPGMYGIPFEGEDGDDTPAASSLAAHGLILEELQEDIRQALAKWLSRADAADLNRYNNFHEDQKLEKVEVELRPEDSSGRKRRDKFRITFSLLVSQEEDEQFLVSVPKLVSPPLSFYCYRLNELQKTAEHELAAYFSDTTLEELLHYQHQRQENLDWIEVEFSPIKPQAEKKKGKADEEATLWALKGVGINLTARVRENKLLRAYRRDSEIKKILDILASERNSSLMLVGPSGVGKTAIVHEVARRIREEQCPKALLERQVWMTTPGQLISGCMYIGQWEEKLKNVIEELKRKRHILLVDDVMGLIDQGKSLKTDDNMAQFLKPYIADGTVVMIGESSPERYRIGENRDPGFTRLFRTVQIEETNEDATLSILGTVGAGLERELKLRIAPGANEAALELTRRFQPYRAFPGKAISLVETVAAEMGRESTEAETGTGREARPTLSRQALVSAFARITGLPEFLLSDHLMLDLEGVEAHFRERLIGQEGAVQTVVDLVTVIKAGLNDPNKPLGGFFFVGPTGVGKTEMAKTLAEYLFGSRNRILRFDMSEYAEPYNVAKLIGSAIGDEEGELTKRIRLQPFSVVLLDEFEKAHSSIFDVMLQVLGEGRLTDAGGRTADFRSAIILMTSNLGASQREQRKTGLRSEENPSGAQDRHYLEQVEKFFRPEFVNRLDQIVVFRALDREAMRRIAARELQHLLAREGVLRRNLLVEIDDSMMDLLLETGFSPVYGARPLKREIEKRIIVPLSRHLVANRITGSQLIQIRRDGEKVELVSSLLTEAKQRVTRESGALDGGDAGARRMDVQELIEGLAAVRLHLHVWAQKEITERLQAEYSQLLYLTRESKDFVAYGEEAHRTWERIHHIERVLKRLTQLTERAEYLEEFAGIARRERSSRYEADLAQSYTELCRDTDFLEIELLCANESDTGQALLRLKPLGRTARPEAQSAWLRTLATIYLRWANRKGYALSVFLPKAIPQAEEIALAALEETSANTSGKGRNLLYRELEAGDFSSLLKQLEASAPQEIAISLRGINVYGFLKGEAGTHKLLIRADDTDPAAPFQTAVLEVMALEAEERPQSRLLALRREERRRKAAGEAAPPAPEIVRLYAPDGDRFVRDPRTDKQTTQVAGVLDGYLDEFILAALRTQSNRVEE